MKQNHDSQRISDLIEVAFDALNRMQLKTGYFCNHIVKGDARQYGRSIRYTAMVLLGLEKAKAAGWTHPLNESHVYEQVFDELTDGEIRPGDLGLFLWLNARSEMNQSIKLVSLLRTKIEATNGLSSLEGMEIAWIVIGLAHTVAGCHPGSPEHLFKEAFEELVRRQDAGTGLFYHLGNRHPRSRFPNFATQIYGVLALAFVAELDLDERAIRLAKKAADRLLSLQYHDGGWPWILDARKGKVVEPYEIYSVHQDGMAPMALLKLTEVSNDFRYTEAALAGLEWIYGRNDLSCFMVDRIERMIYRSIGRKRPWNRLLLVGNTILASLIGRAFVNYKGLLELNATCRPYHMGWILEAWCGREVFTNVY